MPRNKEKSHNTAPRNHLKRAHDTRSEGTRSGAGGFNINTQKSGDHEERPPDPGRPPSTPETRRDRGEENSTVPAPPSPRNERVKRQSARLRPQNNKAQRTDRGESLKRPSDMGSNHSSKPPMTARAPAGSRMGNIEANRLEPCKSTKNGWPRPAGSADADPAYKQA